MWKDFESVALPGGAWEGRNREWNGDCERVWSWIQRGSHGLGADLLSGERRVPLTLHHSISEYSLLCSALLGFHNLGEKEKITFTTRFYILLLLTLLSPVHVSNHFNMNYYLFQIICFLYFFFFMIYFFFYLNHVGGQNY